MLDIKAWRSEFYPSTCKKMERDVNKICPLAYVHAHTHRDIKTDIHTNICAHIYVQTKILSII